MLQNCKSCARPVSCCAHRCWKKTSTGLALFAVKMPKEDAADLAGINDWLGTEEPALQILAGVPRTVQL